MYYTHVYIYIYIYDRERENSKDRQAERGMKIRLPSGMGNTVSSRRAARKDLKR